MVNGKLTQYNSLGNGSLWGKTKMFRDTSRPYHAFIGSFFTCTAQGHLRSFYTCHRHATILKLKIFKRSPCRNCLACYLWWFPIKFGWQFVFFDFRSPIFKDCYSKIVLSSHCTVKLVLRDHCYERPDVLNSSHVPRRRSHISMYT